MSEKMSEKWNSTFFGAPAALNSTEEERKFSTGNRNQVVYFERKNKE